MLIWTWCHILKPNAATPDCRMFAADGQPASAKLAQEARSYDDCYPRYAQQMCAVNAAEQALTILLMACAYIYFALYFFHLIQALLKLKDLPRQDNKMASLQIRLQVRHADDISPQLMQPYRDHAGCTDHSATLSIALCVHAVQDTAAGDSLLHPQHRAAVVCEAAGLPQLLLHLVWHAPSAGGLLQPRARLPNLAPLPGCSAYKGDM